MISFNHVICNKNFVTFSCMVLVAVLMHHFTNRTRSASSCLYLFDQAKRDVCNAYRSGSLIGEFCNDICLEKGSKGDLTDDERAAVELIECPDLDSHSGKELVLSLIWRQQKLILKGHRISSETIWREMTLSKDGSIDQATIDDLMHIVNDSITEVNGNNAFINPIHLMLPYHTEDSMNLSSWKTLSLLTQDTEFLISRLSDQLVPASDALFPRIISSCGHLYVTDLGEEVLESSYILPSHSVKSAKQKLDACISLMKFLIRFSIHYPGLEICDVKLDQFAFFHSKQQLLMIDSDMIFKMETVNASQNSIRDCSSDDDCNFFDCRGICNNTCTIHPTDNNLKRLCRNIIFPFMDHSFFFWTSKVIGLLSDLPNESQELVSQIRKLCESNERVLDSAYEMLKLLTEIRIKIF